MAASEPTFSMSHSTLGCLSLYAFVSACTRASAPPPLETRYRPASDVAPEDAGGSTAPPPHAATRSATSARCIADREWRKRDPCRCMTALSNLAQTGDGVHRPNGV